jgi:hypothetical protein
MNAQELALRTWEAQRLTHVTIGGEMVTRTPWDPAAEAEMFGIGMDESTPCNDCGVSAGQLHWPTCDQDRTADGNQTCGLPLDAYSDGGPEHVADVDRSR